MTHQKVPQLTIVGGQPEKASRKQKLEVPVGLEQVLFLAARNKGFKHDLFADRQGAIERLGISLRPTEITILKAVSDKNLSAMIDRIRPENPKRRKLMRLVAATATSLAAGTVVMSCGKDDSAGSRIDIEIDAGDDAGEDSDGTSAD